jgi:L-amino acid N-acyltransferase YncA
VHAVDTCSTPDGPFGAGNYDDLAGLPDAAVHVSLGCGNPLPDASVDVVISNCVIVLSGDKAATFAEIARVLRPGGRVGISDIVRAGPDDGTPTTVSCAATAISPDDYDDALRRAGLGQVSVELTEPIGAGLSKAIIRARKPAVTIRPMTPADWPAVRDIYAAGMATGNATFETAPPSWEEWNASHLDEHRLVATDDHNAVIGWASLSPVSDRCVYAGVAENSLYIGADHRGQGAGTTLLDALVIGAEQAGYWTIQTGIFPENTASIAVHQSVGFRIVGRRERVGQLNGVWRDTLFLERRSRRI